MDLTKKQLIELVQFATGKIHNSFTWNDEAEDTVDEYLKAINYTHCCTELKGKYVPNFEEWKFINKYTQKGLYIYDENGQNYMNSDLKEKYINEILNL